MEHLLLQRPHSKSKSKNNTKHLLRRLLLWQKGDIQSLLDECRTIQNYLKKRKKKVNDKDLARIFSNLIFKGKIGSAIRFLDENARKGGVLSITPEVEKELKELHPEPAPSDKSVLIKGVPPQINPIIFDEITSDSIRKAAVRTSGSSGISGGDSEHWRRILFSFGEHSNRLADALASFSRRLCSQHLDPDSLAAFIANRLIPIDKCPGIRPIGIGRTVRRITGKAIMTLLKSDVMKATGATQVCAGQEAGIEAVIHAMIERFKADEVDAILLVDATNAFNRLNRMVALHNIRFLCPSISTALINLYRTPARLFVPGGLEISSQEGTTQGCPFAMAMYSLGSMPLINKLRNLHVTQAWYADDSQAAGKLSNLLNWWDEINTHGPSYGYYPKPSKSYLIVKPDTSSEAKKLFSRTKVKIVEGGKRDLGAAIGSKLFVENFLNEKVTKWTDQIKCLSKIASTQPHAAHAAFVHGIRGRWTFSQRTMKQMDKLIAPLEKAIRDKFLPSLIGDDISISDNDRALYALPARYGGLGINNPVTDSPNIYNDSIKVSANLKNLILKSEPKLIIDRDQQNSIKKTIRTKFVFSMLRSSLVCLRGSRSINPNKRLTTFTDIDINTPASVITHEARLC